MIQRSEEDVDKIVNANVPRAHFWKRKYERFFGSNEALSIAFEGLLKAARQWDERIPFSPFANTMIRWTFSLHYRKMTCTRRGAGIPLLSLDCPLSEGGETFGAVFSDDGEAANRLTLSSDREWMERIFSELDERDPRLSLILRGRFGFDGEPKTLEVISQSLGITRQRVRQLEQIGLNRMAKAMGRKPKKKRRYEAHAVRAPRAWKPPPIRTDFWDESRSSAFAKAG